MNTRLTVSLMLLPPVVFLAAVVSLAQGAPGGRGGGGMTPELQQLRRVNGIRNAPVHDPSTIVKCGEEYWLFATGNNCPAWRSSDLINWTAAGTGLAATPAWVTREVPAFRGNNFWAPDVIKVKDRYMLFYSASEFGVNTSTIGVTTNPTLDRNDPKFKWTDGGEVVTSKAGDDFNAIDPAPILDADGRLYMAFGSFWSGIQLIELDPDTGTRLPNAPMTKLAHFDSIEAPFIYRHGGKYYLFASLGMCCRQAASTYNTRVGRANQITGPYLDKEGKDMLLGGGSPFLATEGALIGPGHAGIIAVGDKFYFSCHYESTGGAGTLAVRPLTWDAHGWPVAGDAQ